MKKLFILITFSSILMLGCSSNKAKIPSKSPCACYDIIVYMDKEG